MRKMPLLSLAIALNAVSFACANWSIACPQPNQEQAGDRQLVTKYSKEWTDFYANFNKVVYLAYSKTLKDEKGNEVVAEIWHGRATGYYKSGSKTWEGTYLHGKREGEFTYWAKDGTKTGLSVWVNGQMHGKYTQWTEDGRKMREETYEKGKLNGEASWWDCDGKVVATGTYRNNRPWTGTFVELDRDPVYVRVVRKYSEGTRGSAEKLTQSWWW